MINLTGYYHQFASTAANLLQDVYISNLINVIFEQERESWLISNLKRDSKMVKGLNAIIPFLTDSGWSFRPITKQGYFPSGSPATGVKQSLALGFHGGGLQVDLEEIETTKGDEALIGEIMKFEIDRLMEQFKYYLRLLMWSGEAGVIGVVSAVDGTTVTLDNDGLTNTSTYDRCKYLVDGMWIHVFNSSDVMLTTDGPRKITSVDVDAGTFTIDTAVTGMADGDQIAITSIDGLEHGFDNHGTPGVLDVIDSDNTFQGVDRSATANRKLRALVTANNSGDAAAIDIDALKAFFHKLYNPATAITDYRVIEAIWKYFFQDRIRFVDSGALRGYIDDYDYIKIGKTKLVSSEDAHCDKILVPDYNQMVIADHGPMQNFRGRGWYQMEKRPVLTYDLVWISRLIAKDCRRMGQYYNFDYTTTPTP